MARSPGADRRHRELSAMRERPDVTVGFPLFCEGEEGEGVRDPMSEVAAADVSPLLVSRGQVDTIQRDSVSAPFSFGQ